MTLAEKWAEYRRVRGLVFSVCWDCRKPCAMCREWARCKVFGKSPDRLDPFYAAAIEQGFRAASEMERRGTRMFAEIR